MARTLTPAQRAQSDARKERFRALAKQIADMTDDQRVELASRVVGITTIEGHALSPNNVCLIAMQNPCATLVGGFRQWLKAGRAVRKGEHGLMIWVPIRKGDAAESVAKSFAWTGNASEPADKSERTRFICGTVFDVSQTIEVETGAPALA